MPIFFTFDNNYVEPAAVAFFSLLDKAKEDVRYDMFVLHSNVTEEKQRLLKDVVGRKGNGTLTFIPTEGFMDEYWQKASFSRNASSSVFTSDAIVRCFAARFFPKYDKIIYSDVDIIVADDISDLFDYEIGDSYLLGVKNPFMKYSPQELSHLKPEHYGALKDSYIAGGIWVMNLKKIREDDIERKMLDVIEDETIIKRWNDQDIVNVACMGRVGFIPLNYISYPYMIDLLGDNTFKSHYTREELFDSIIHPKIIHFAANKPWNGTPNYSSLWYSIFDYLQLERTGIFRSRPKFRLSRRKLVFAILLAIYTILLVLLPRLF